MSRVQVVISSQLRSQLRRVLEEARPRECCGALLGRIENDGMVVRRIVVTHNTTGMAESFSISDAEMERVHALSSVHGEPVIALFHSHPNGPSEPSVADRTALAFSEWPWVIITPDATAEGVELRYCEKSGQGSEGFHSLLYERQRAQLRSETNKTRPSPV
jgi:proteasome lid subunit RPN8/RPN11